MGRQPEFDALIVGFANVLGNGSDPVYRGYAPVKQEIVSVGVKHVQASIKAFHSMFSFTGSMV